MHNKKEKVSAEPIVDYSQSQVLTSDDHVSALESIVEKKIRVAKEKKKAARERALLKKQKELQK